MVCAKNYENMSKFVTVTYKMHFVDTLLFLRLYVYKEQNCIQLRKKLLYCFMS